MIDHNLRTIFIHQRKCAGTSLLESFDLSPKDPAWHFMNDGVLSPEYAEAPDGYFTFSIVRNPWDRFISGWKYCESTRHRPLRDVLENLPREGHDYRHLTRPQHVILHDNTGRCVLDDLIRFETLQQDFDRVCYRLGKPRRQLPHSNRGNRKAYTDYFDAECRRLFLRQFEQDVDLFAYQY